jgi:hypothetical protein
MRLFESLPVIPELITSRFVPRGQGYKLMTEDVYGRPKILLVVHPDDAAAFADKLA